MKKINSVLQLISSLRILLGPFSSFKAAEALELPWWSREGCALLMQGIWVPSLSGN